MALSIPQAKIAHCKTRFRVAICGRRFGKTILSIRELCKAARLPHQEVWYIAPSYRQAKGIVWRQLKYKLSDLNWIEKVNESDLSIVLRNGSQISLKGADNYDSLRGVGLNFIVLDEFADIDEEAFYEVLRPTLSDKEGGALFIGTPKGKGNWSYDLFQNQHTDDEWTSFKFTTIEGGFVKKKEIDAARKLLDARTFDQEYNADFVTASSRIWYAFDEATHIKPYLNKIPNLLYTGWDFNIDPMSIIVFARDGDVVHAIDEITIYGSNTQEAVEELKHRYPKQRIKAYPDPASRQRKTSAGGKTDMSILENAGFQTFARNSTESVRDGINAVNSKLMNSLGDPTFFVDPKCTNLIKSLARHEYKHGTSQPDKNSGFDHMSDAMRYYFDYEFPVRKDVKKKASKRWGHAASL